MFSLSKLSDFSLTHAEDGYFHWTYNQFSKEASQPAEGACVKGKVIYEEANLIVFVIGKEGFILNFYSNK